jgi:hypothetical protein
VNLRFEIDSAVAAENLKSFLISVENYTSYYKSKEKYFVVMLRSSYNKLLYPLRLKIRSGNQASIQ